MDEQIMVGDTVALDGGYDFKVFIPLLKAMAPSDDGRKRLSGVASSTVKDLHGDRMTENAIAEMLKVARNDMTVFLNHNYKVPEDVLGTVEKASITRDGNTVLLSFDSIVVDDANPRALQTAGSIANGSKLGLSIGARIPEGGATWDEKAKGYIIDHVQLLEASIVSLPANPRSWVDRMVKSLTGVFPEDLDRTEEGASPRQIRAMTEMVPEVLPANGTSVLVTIDGPHVAVGTGVPNIGIEIPLGGVGELTSVEGEILPDIIELTEGDDITSDHNDTPDDVSVTASQDAPSTTGDEAAQADAIEMLTPAMAQSLDASRSVIERLLDEVSSARTERDQAIHERNEAVELAHASMSKTAELLEQIKRLPTGRRTVMTRAAADIASMSDMLAPEAYQILERNALRDKE